MRILILIISIIFLSNLEVKAQDYVPFPTDSAEWTQWDYREDFGFGSWFGGKFYMLGDTTLQMVSYKKIFFLESIYLDIESAVYIGGLREDSLKRVFFKPDSISVNNSGDDRLTLSFPDTTEKLLYDFQNLNIGDTISYEGSPDMLEFGYNYIIFDSLQVEVGGGMRKGYLMTTHLTDSEIFPDLVIFLIEGIGATRGLLSPYSTVSTISDYEKSFLTCYHENTIDWQMDLYPDFILANEVVDCNVLPISITEIDHVSTKFFPNPASQDLTIESSGLPILSVLIYDQIGNTVKSDLKVNSHKVKMDVSDLTSGLYFIHITDAAGVVTQKLVKE